MYEVYKFSQIILTIVVAALKKVFVICYILKTYGLFFLCGCLGWFRIPREFWTFPRCLGSSGPPCDVHFGVLGPLWMARGIWAPPGGHRCSGLGFMVCSWPSLALPGALPSGQGGSGPSLEAKYVLGPPWRLSNGCSGPSLEAKGVLGLHVIMHLGFWALPGDHGCSPPSLEVKDVLDPIWRPNHGCPGPFLEAKGVLGAPWRPRVFWALPGDQGGSGPFLEAKSWVFRALPGGRGGSWPSLAVKGVLGSPWRPKGFWVLPGGQGCSGPPCDHAFGVLGPL